MDDPDAPDSEADHLTWFHPLARWRHISRSPGYRLGAINRRLRIAAALIGVAAVVAVPGFMAAAPDLGPASKPAAQAAQVF